MRFVTSSTCWQEKYIVPFPRDWKRLYKPPINYPQIKKTVWIKFVDQRLSDAFQVSIFDIRYMFDLMFSYLLTFVGHIQINTFRFI